MIAVPNGIDQIIKTFGNIHDYIASDGSLNDDWEMEQMTIITLPFVMPLSWAPSTEVARMTCHKLIAPVFVSVFNEIAASGYQNLITGFGGCYQYRPQRNSSKISTHAWGIAIDLNPLQNEQGTVGNIDPNLIRIFKAAGFEWGGEFQGKRTDPMHFQYATGY